MAPAVKPLKPAGPPHHASSLFLVVRLLLLVLIAWLPCFFCKTSTSEPKNIAGHLSRVSSLPALTWSRTAYNHAKTSPLFCFLTNRGQTPPSSAPPVALAFSLLLRVFLLL